MTVHLEWPDDLVARLTEEARKKGLSLDAYLLQTVLHEIVNETSASNDAQRRQARQRAAARIRETRKEVTLGPDLTIRDLINEGRRF